MCGIFGYIGTDQHSIIKALRGIKDLEYRGYDSWGVAVKTNKGIFTKKAIGKVSLINEDDFSSVMGTVALAHTRWATHGTVTCKNAHPHFSADGSIAVVLNGIIENHKAIKDELVKGGNVNLFVSETDAEVIPHLIDFYIQKGLSFERAFVKTCKRLKGRFAFATFHKDLPFILAARGGSPLAVGVSEGEYYIASDTPAFLDYTNDVYFMSDGEYIKTDGETASFHNFKTGKEIHKKIATISRDKTNATKKGFAHFMLKEILEQKESLVRALKQDEDEIKKSAKLLGKNKQNNNLICTASGTAGNVCMMAEYYFGEIAKREMHFVAASEFSKNVPFLNRKSVVLMITQSGETADVLEAARAVKRKKAKIFSLINVRGSSVEHISDSFLPINAGPEKAVASTKAATSQVIVIMLLAFALAGEFKKGKASLTRSVRKINMWLDKKLLAHIKKVAKGIVEKDDLYVIGNNINYPVALEAALKIKEVSYIHAEGFAAGELKHGPIALIEKKTPCIVLVSNDEHKNDILNSTEELKARGAYIIGIASEKSPLFNRWIPIPDLGIATPLAHIIATQILAYYLATLRGLDPDMPRNLAKSVTVK